MLTTVRAAKCTTGRWIGAVRAECNPGEHWVHLMVNGRLRGNAPGGIPDLHTASWIQRGFSPIAVPAPIWSGHCHNSRTVRIATRSPAGGC
jgi:hypothetical protein